MTKRQKAIEVVRALYDLPETWAPEETQHAVWAERVQRRERLPMHEIDDQYSRAVACLAARK